MAGRCTNCNSRLGCSCQKRTASDGTSCCANCIATYEKGINKVNRPVKRSNVAPTSPTNVKATATYASLGDL